MKSPSNRLIWIVEGEMSVLTEEMKATWKKVKVFAVGTASKTGIPNVAPIGSVMLRGEETSGSGIISE